MEDLESLIEPELKEILDEVIKSLTKDKDNEEIATFTPINNEIALEFLAKEGIDVYNDFKPQLVTPYAIAKYISLLKEETYIVTRVTGEMEELGFNESIQWSVAKGFTNEINFIKMEVDEKPQGLKVKYRLDNETDTIIYTIAAGNWGWDVSKSQLYSLITNQEKIVSTDVKPIRTKSDLVFQFNGMEISVRKI